MARSPSNKRSYATYRNDLPVPRHLASAPTWKPLPPDPPVIGVFSNWTRQVEWILDKMARRNPQIGEPQWGETVSYTILKTVEDIILTRISKKSMRTRLDALHALIEIATAVAYAPHGVSPDVVRKSDVPAFLIKSMCKIMKEMEEYEIGYIVLEKAFVEKLKRLRHNPLVPWIGKAWNGLDDVLRFLKDSGPVDFRQCVGEIDERLEKQDDKCNKNRDTVVKIIRNEISGYFKKDTCFGTKYNALNALVDIAMRVMERPLSEFHDQSQWDLVSDTLSAAMLGIGKMMKETDIDRLLAETRAVPAMAAPSYLIEFSNTHEKIATLRRLVGRDQSNPRDCPTLIGKILYLRWMNPSSFLWTPKSWNTLDEVLDLFIDESFPINCDSFLTWLANVLAPNRAVSEATVSTRNIINRNITRITRRITSRAGFEIKLQVLKILTTVGRSIALWLNPVVSGWRRECFRDHTSEELITNAMMTICRSLEKEDWAKVFSDQKLLDDIIDLDLQRRRFLGAFPGFDAVLGAIHDPRNFLGRGVPARPNTIEKPPPKKAKIIQTIDLTDDPPPLKIATKPNFIETIDLTDK